ncbi:MAG: hypothetical protein U0P28_01315 [Ruminococcus sp.]
MENNLVNYYSLFQLDRAETTAALYGKLEDLMKRAQMDNTFEDSDVVRRQQIKQAMEIFSSEESRRDYDAKLDRDPDEEKRKKYYDLKKRAFESAAYQLETEAVSFAKAASNYLELMPVSEQLDFYVRFAQEIYLRFHQPNEAVSLLLEANQRLGDSPEALLVLAKCYTEKYFFVREQQQKGYADDESPEDHLRSRNAYIDRAEKLAEAAGNKAALGAVCGYKAYCLWFFRPADDDAAREYVRRAEQLGDDSEEFQMVKRDIARIDQATDDYYRQMESYNARLKQWEKGFAADKAQWQAQQNDIYEAWQSNVAQAKQAQAVLQKQLDEKQAAYKSMRTKMLVKVGILSGVLFLLEVLRIMGSKTTIIDAFMSRLMPIFYVGILVAAGVILLMYFNGKTRSAAAKEIRELTDKRNYAAQYASQPCPTKGYSGYAAARPAPPQKRNDRVYY